MTNALMRALADSIDIDQNFGRRKPAASALRAHAQASARNASRFIDAFRINRLTPCVHFVNGVCRKRVCARDSRRLEATVHSLRTRPRRFAGAGSR